ncbi:acetyl-CoA C-acyltransferase [Longimonas halophila]|uniref:acetyl-CoA C-acyltransferase n=1 Tax=Longimonas halophila TaxID=1469170 RepID=A0A2H3PAR9_9BACT|nr:acetyl-CoA C-acyltransferase [Longimonas halophila]PEN09368.1 acetyl-CoA C-acyltransferase [Longimonas halophila]
MAASPDARTPVFIDGGRLPFQRSGTGYVDLMAYDMGRMALKGLLMRTGLDASTIDRVIMGTVVQDVETSNVARESALAAGIPNTVPAHTVTQACISSNQAVTSGMDLIRAGQGDVVVASGTETLSDPPIRVRRPLRKKLFEARKYKSPQEFLSLLKDLSPSDLLPESPSIAEFSTGEVMGESADKLAAMFGVSREEQDEYALLTHHRAAAAQEDGRIDKELFPASVPPDFDPITKDNVVRPDTTLEKLSGLGPAFVKPFGTVTAGNSSALTDGASASLIMSYEHAQSEGFTPRAALREYTYVAQDPGAELLLGPAYAIPQVLDAAGMTLADIDVIELHEAFAGQVLAVLEALASDRFAEEHLNRADPVGRVDMDILNTRGGSVSLGHPFGATGVRLVTTAVNRLYEEDGQWALVSACAAGGQGHALLIERLG